MIMALISFMHTPDKTKGGIDTTDE
jgi:hypothetical protein